MGVGNVKFSAARANRRSSQEFGDHIQTAVTHLQGELGSRLDALDVAFHGLAVKGDWSACRPADVDRTRVQCREDVEPVPCHNILSHRLDLVEGPLGDMQAA